MRLGVFELTGPLPDLREPHALAVLRPWIDVGSVGTLTLSRVESLFKTEELGRLARPGEFFDLTRYRPTSYVKGDQRELAVPNTTIAYARADGKNDFLFLRLLEPHMLAETYVESVLELFKRLGVKRYCLLGSMYDMVPYTRPLLVTGTGSNLKLQNELETASVLPSEYVGPTTIVSQSASQMGIETYSLIVHLPQYLTLEEDYRGETRLMQMLGSMYGFPVAQEDLDKAKGQTEWVSQVSEQVMQQEPRYRPILEHLEASYDSRVNKKTPESKLSPELEQLLQDLGKRFGQN
ncbi:MAG: PAC2 family protein [Chloroflexi bacterium]|nr:PAC2 family protein [Chloroflexota bacterium]